ncbi:MAG: restriction endonuclease subunit S [Candidatus Thiodiazotropha lotti]|nr:restriction endonuclease subunit S [Candidatus Thiodiazotropha lotti]MCW4187856.1 restriction endonuclease subunit S [Candidatus Thiodiazotropha lotti]
MKSSSPAWIPSKVKYLANYINGYPFKPSEWSDRGKPIIRIQNLTNPDAEPNFYEGEIPKAYLVREGDLLLSWSASLGAYEWKGPEAWLNQHIFKVELDSEHVTKSYYKWLAEWFMEELNEQAHGSTMQHVTKDRFGGFKVNLPPLDLQQIIVSYLDRETTHIDTLIAEKERMLALLDEKRAALISQAVTRGLDLDVPLKSSGLDWLGDIPAHWNLVRIKYLVTELTQGSSPQASNTPAEPNEDGVLKLSAVSKGRFVRGENKALRESDGSAQLLSLRKGDVLVTRGNTPELVADACFVPQDEPNLLIPDLIYRLRLNPEKVLPELLSYFLVTKEARTQIRRDARGSSGSMVKVSQEHVASWIVPIPPNIAEQEKIVHRMVQVEHQLRSLSDELQESVRLLKERRSTLITAAVTGQIDAKDMVA